MARLIAIGVVFVWLTILIGNFDIVAFYWAMLALFALSTIAQYQVGKREPPFWISSIAFPTLDIVLICLAGLWPNPLDPEAVPPPMGLKLSNHIYFMLILCTNALSYVPGRVAWTGIASGAVWLAAAFIISFMPGMTTEFVLMEDGGAPWYEQAMRADFVNLNDAITVAIVYVLAGLTLAAVVQRARRMVLRQTATARARANLTRYFPPNVVKQLQERDQPFADVRQQKVAVMFVDMVGFTRQAEGMTPQQMVGFVRQFHRRMEGIVFANDGTLDKYLGDGLMVTFGTPATGPRDAADAVSCALAIQVDMAAWNRERASHGLPPVRVGVGIHYGDVVMADVGAARRLEFAVLGDTVNVASRLEELTRGLGADIVASDEAIQAAQAQGADVSGFRRAPAQALRGRDAPIEVWLCGVEADS